MIQFHHPYEDCFVLCDREKKKALKYNYINIPFMGVLIGEQSELDEMPDGWWL